MKGLFMGLFMVVMIKELMLLRFQEDELCKNKKEEEEEDNVRKSPCLRFYIASHSVFTIRATIYAWSLN